MSNSRSRIPSPARSMPLTPRRRETPRKTRSVCSPARSSASCRLSSIVREHREQSIGSFGLSPMSRRSVLNDNTDIDVPGRQSWWKELGDNSQDVMDVLKDNNPEPHNIFDNIEVLSQEEKQHTIIFDKIDSSDSESIRSIIIPQRKLFHEKENQPLKKMQPFGTRETLEKLDKTNTANVDKNISVTAVKNALFKNDPPSRPVFPAGLLNISSNSTASEKTMTIVEPKRRAHNLFNKQQNVNKSQALKRKNMFNKFIESDSEEELPEIQPKFFALQRKTDSKRPSLASRGLDATLTSSMDIEMDDWQLLPSSTMVEHQLNTTLTAGSKPTRLRLSKLSEAETGTNSSNTSQTKSSKNTSVVQEKSPRQNASIVTRNRSKTFNNPDEEMNKSQSKSPSSPNASQSSILTRSKNKSNIANKSQNDSINKSRNSNKSKNASKISIKPIDVDKNTANQSSTKDPVVPNMEIGNKSPDSELKEAADNEDDGLNFSLQYEEDNIDESDEENLARNASVIDNSNKKMNTSKNVTHTDSGANKTNNISPTVKDAQNIEKKEIDESGDIPDNKSHTATQNANKSNVLDPFVVEDKVNEIRKSPSKIVEMEHEGNKEFKEQNQEVAQENIIDKGKNIETHQLENKDKQNEIQENKESHKLHNDIQEKRIENQEEHNEYQEKLNKSKRDQIRSQGEQQQSKKEESESPELQIGNLQLLNKSKEGLNEIQDKQDKSLNVQDENQKIPNYTEEVQLEIHNKQDENLDIQDKNPGITNDTKEVQKEVHDEQDESLNIQDENPEIQNDTKEVQNEIHDEHHESLNIQDESQEIPNDSEEEDDESEEENNESEEENNESEDENEEEIEEENNESEEENNESEEENNETAEANNEEEIADVQNISQKKIDQNESGVEQPEIENEDANESVNAAAESDQNNTQDSEMECEDTNESKNATAVSDQNDIEENDSGNEANESLEAVADSDHDYNNENENEEENDSESEAINESLEATADTDHDDDQENEIDEDNDTEDEDVNKSLEATEESDQNNQENESEHEEDQVENLETPNVSHDTTGRNRKKSTPEAVLRNSRSEIELTRVRGRNTSARKTKSLIGHTNRPSLEPARESMESIGAGNSSAEGSGWDSHRTTRKTLRQTFGKDFTPRKSLRALVMEKSAKRRATAIDDTVPQARPQANSTEFPEPDITADDYEMATDPPVQEVSMRTRQMRLEECLEVAKKEWAERDAKAKAIVQQRLEQHNRKPVDDPFKVPETPWFARRTAQPVKKTNKRVKPLMSLENMPEEFIEDMKYKPPKRFAPRNASWLTKRLYKFLETKLEPKYNYKARVRAEKFAQMLYEFVQSLRRRGAPPVAPPHAVDALKREMARLNFVKTHYDFYNFFHDYMPREIRVKVNPDIINNIPLPKNGIFSDIL